MSAAHCLVQTSINVQARTAIAAQRRETHVRRRARGVSESPINRYRKSNTLIKRPFAKILEGNIGQCCVSANAPTIGKLAIKRKGRTPITCQIAADVDPTLKAIFEVIVD